MNRKKIAIIFLTSVIGMLIIGNALKNISPDIGQKSYELHCAGCHGKDGLGLGGIVPPLANADWVKNNQDKLACVIKNGMEGEVTVNGKIYNQEMLGLPYLSDIQITNIINYINASWGNNYGFVKVESIEQQLRNCQ